MKVSLPPIKRLAYLFILSSCFIFLGTFENANAQAPTITSFSPATGPVGTLVTVSGTNLNNPATFVIGGVSAIIVSNTGTIIVAMVMPYATTGPISVISAGVTASSAGNFTVTSTSYPSTQQGNKLIGTGNVGGAWQGWSLSISADGNTAIVGGRIDNSGQGAAWVYTRNGSIWTQQGNKLVGSGNLGAAQQGISVSISADGNTVIMGGTDDNSNQGAAWVFNRSGGVWTQQGLKLVGAGNIGAARQGISVSLSADGNTAIMGGFGDNLGQGAAWIFIRSNGTWTQQGGKLVGTGNSGRASQGYSVSLSADGNTAIVGGYGDSSFLGAAWVYTRKNDSWTQQGAKLVGTAGVGSSQQGWSVSLSADGNTAILGGIGDNSNQGAAWIFIRSGNIWTQQGAKLIGTGNIGGAQQGCAVSLSANGNVVIVGGNRDNSWQGAAWVFTRNGDIWTQQGSKLVGTGNIGSAYQGSSVSMSANGNTALLGGNRDNSFQGAAWVFIATPKIYFRSIISGNWNDPNTWESSPVEDFSSGVVSPAAIPPDTNANSINIRQGHTITLTENVSVRHIFVHPDGRLDIIGCNLTILND
jgi:hypothetical protein